MSVLEHLEPHGVFRFFEALCAIPHGSGNCGAISDWCVAFAQRRDLTYIQDRLGNVILFKPASPGYENAAPIILQGHLDMVCQRASDCTLDFLREGLRLGIDGDEIFARGTSLGGDDGIAVAMILAVLDSDTLAHPPIEALFTVDEEIGMLGAQALDTAPLKGRRLINLDSEQEGVFTAGCAGGIRARGTLPIKRQTCREALMTLSVSGLVGGHSGTEIHWGRANALQLLGRALDAIAQATDLQIVDLEGGEAENAIPQEARAVIAVRSMDAARPAVETLAAALQNEFHAAETHMALTIEQGAPPSVSAMTPHSSRRVMDLLLCLPNGVQTMVPGPQSLVQTSLNLGRLRSSEAAVQAGLSIRSSVDSEKQLLMRRVERVLCGLGGSVTWEGNYPGWAFQEDSPLRRLMTEVFVAQTGTEPTVAVIHAGLECGLLAAKLPGLDCVSMGPDLRQIHSASERLCISSVQRVWTLLLEILRRLR